MIATRVTCDPGDSTIAEHDAMATVNVTTRPRKVQHSQKEDRVEDWTNWTSATLFRENNESPPNFFPNGRKRLAHALRRFCIFEFFTGGAPRPSRRFV